MLQRIVAIKNIGRFRKCSPVDDVMFRRFTLVFAENGRGKTTLCAILRSLLTNIPAYVLGRATLGSIEAPEVQLLTSAGNIAFRRSAWTTQFSNIAIFDGTYVSENVFAGDVVDTEQRRNLYRVIIGAEGVTLAGRIVEIDNAIASKNREIRDARARIQQHAPTGITLEAFLALAEDAEIDGKIAAKEQELQGVQRAAQLQQRAGLSALSAPTFPPAFAQLLGKTFANVAEDAERLVGKHIARHKMQGRGERWLTEGLRYVTDDSRPFCAQGLTRVELGRVNNQASQI